jgi:hypothetical protein
MPKIKSSEYSGDTAEMSMATFVHKHFLQERLGVDVRGNLKQYTVDETK